MVDFAALEVFTGHRSLLFKKVRVVRFLDQPRNSHEFSSNSHFATALAPTLQRENENPHNRVLTAHES